MLVNHEHKLIFVHIPRTGGTSVRFALREAGIEFEVVGLEHGNLGRHHAFAGYYSFSIVRNPYEWLLSLYSLISQAKDHPFHAMVKRNDFAWFVKWYIATCQVVKYRRQVDFIGDRNGLIVADWFKLEEIDDLRYTLRRRLKRNIKIKHLHSAQRLCEISEVKRINEFFQEDFETFGYEME